MQNILTEYLFSYFNRSLIALTSVLLIIGTLIDIFSTSDMSLIRLIVCFSIIRNTKLLFKISDIKKTNNLELKFIHGLRVLSTLWIIIGHSVGFTCVPMLMKISPFTGYPEDGIEILKTVIFQYIVNGGLSVQIFFIIRYIIIRAQEELLYETVSCLVYVVKCIINI
jgi:hypothetical protein